MLDAVAACTPWRLRLDRQGYAADVRNSAFDMTRNSRFHHYLRPGGMWSDEMLEDHLYMAWFESLTTGQRPQGH